MTSFKTLLGLCALRIRRQPGIAAAVAGLSWPLLALLSPAVGAQTTFSYTGAVQAYTVPAGAGGVQIQAAGAGGGSGGNDANGWGGAGGAGARATGTYYAAPGTVLNIYVGQGGRAGNTSQGAYTCANAAGAGGLAGGATGFAGGAGGQAGCSGWSGGGAGGGAASVVATAVNARLVVAGGGGGGQGGALNVLGRAGLNATATGALPGSAGAAGTTRVGDGAGGGGGGGGCPGGAGGASLADSSGANTTAQAVGGSSCREASLVTGFSVTGAAGGAGGTSVTGTAPASGNPGSNGSVTITPLYPTLNIVKSQPSPALVVSGNSTYTLTVSTSTATPAYSARVLDQLPANLTYVSSSGTGWACSTAPNAGGTLVTCNFSGAIAASGGTAAVQITVTPTNNLNVTNYASVDPSGGTSPPNPATCTAANTPSAGCAAPVTSPAATQVGGTVYHDANHNASLDTGEAGIGGTRYVKLAPSSGGSCSGPALVAAAVNSATGAYSIPALAQGNYCLILDSNNTLSDITPQIPGGWIGTQNPSGLIQLSVANAPPVAQNFGFFQGSTLSGIVFADTGVGGGTANNGVKNGTEPGIAGVVVKAVQGATTISTTTAADGSYTLWLPNGLSGSAVTVTPTAPSGYLATGGSAGASGGSYTRPSLSFTPTSGPTYTGANFGLVPPNTLAPNGAQTAQAGTTVFYAHTFQAGSGGQLAFSLANAANPSSPAWSQVLYQDSNCNGALEAAEPLISAPITATAGQTLCLIVKQFVPAGAATGAQNTVTLSAAFSYTNASPALPTSTLNATDITTVGQSGALALSKRVINVTTIPLPPAPAPAPALSINARPGDTLEYTLTADNNGAQPLSTLVVNDATPAFTTYLSAACPGTPLPAGITACSVSTQPAVGAPGALQWTFTGSLASAAQLVVTYRVKVDQ